MTTTSTKSNFNSINCFDLLKSNIDESMFQLGTFRDILQERILLDQRYAQNLQDLTRNIDRQISQHKLQPMAAVCRNLIQHWNIVAEKFRLNTENFRITIFDEILRGLKDFKTFLETELKRDDEQLQQTLTEMTVAEKSYLSEAEQYVSKQKKIDGKSSWLQEKRTTNESLLKHKDRLFHAHNVYVVARKKFLFENEEFSSKLNDLFDFYHDSMEFFEQKWFDLAKTIKDFTLAQSNKNVSLENIFEQIFLNIRSNSMKTGGSFNISPIRPIPFNETAIRMTKFSELKVDEFALFENAQFNSSSDGIKKTTQYCFDELDRLKRSAERLQMQTLSSVEDGTFLAKKFAFASRQLLRRNKNKIDWFSSMIKNLLSIQIVENQLYFHGRLTKEQTVQYFQSKGDFLVRHDDQQRLVLSTCWPNSTKDSTLIDHHFFITENGGSFSIEGQNDQELSVLMLIEKYLHSKIPISSKSIFLLRPIERNHRFIKSNELKLIKTLGKGFFGQVDLGEFRNQKVAVKSLLSKIGPSDEINRSNFINEAMILTLYSHENIVSLIGLVSDQEPMMIVMDFAENGSLKDYLKKKDVPPKKLVQMSIDISKAMEYLESRKVIHRDLAARNCLVDKSERIKVTDFGLSRSLGANDIYISENPMMPFRWTAIDVLSGGPITSKSDVWSYGVTIWEVFSKGIDPYPEIRNLQALLTSLRYGERLQQPDSCPNFIYEIMSQCWLAEPDNRPNFSQIIQMLKKQN